MKSRLRYPGSPYEFTVGEPVPVPEGEDHPMLPVVQPEGEVIPSGQLSPFATSTLSLTLVFGEVENLMFTVEPALPAGLELDGATGIISGLESSPLASNPIKSNITSHQLSPPCRHSNGGPCRGPWHVHDHCRQQRR